MPPAIRETLRAFCKDRGIPLYVEELVNFSGEKAASAQAKRYLDAGDVQGLARLLGAPYFICGTVSTEGRQVGRKLGFPTANIHLAAEKYPLQSGVYAVHLPIEGKVYRGIANYGPRPTFGDDRVVLEIFADGYHGDLYGKQLCVYFDARNPRRPQIRRCGAAAAPIRKRSGEHTMIQFGPSGNSESFYAQGYSHTEQSAKFVHDMGLDCFEYSFGRGVRMSEAKAISIGEAFAAQNVAISVHAPYYINFANPLRRKRAKFL